MCEIFQSRKEKKESKIKSGWFKTRRLIAVLRVQHTPKTNLAKQIGKKIQTDPELAAMKILIQEKNGNQLSRVCNFVNLKIPHFCEREEFLPCLTAEKLTKGSCWREGVNYKIQCLVLDKKYNTEEVYHGE